VGKIPVHVGGQLGMGPVEKVSECSVATGIPRTHFIEKGLRIDLREGVAWFPELFSGDGGFGHYHWLFPWMEPESLQRDFAKDIFSGNPLPPFPSDFRIQMLRAIGPVPVVRSPSGGYTYPAPWSNWRGGKSPYESFL